MAGFFSVGAWHGAGAAGFSKPADDPSPAGVEFFEKKIRPVLTEICFMCHSAQSPQLQGGQLLDSREGMLKGGKRGPAITPGDPDGSLLIKALLHNDKDLKMPPTGKLSDEQIDDFKTWIKMGAPDPRRQAAAAAGLTPKPAYDLEAARKFWSFQTPQEPALPRVKNRRWPKNAIDRFILAKLEGKRLRPSSSADRRTLIRRATFDLIGLPPTPEEVAAFLADKSPNAFAKVVDLLLASPHYGERWGRHWLDLVRYADSAGDSSDYPIPQAYLYRNYVIESFNRDKPYDRFLREQIAGDLMPAHTEAEKWMQAMATGYLAISRRFSVRPEKHMHLTIEDTIDNLGKTTLGMTVSCARCHDHKYDPIPTEDYYGLYGIFSSTRYPFAGSENDQGQKDIVYRLPPSEVAPILKPFEDQLASIDAGLKELEKESEALQQSDTPSETTGKRTLKEIKKEIGESKKRRQALVFQIPALEKAFAVAEGTPRNARVQRRGDPQNPGDEVPRGFLQALGGQKLPADFSASGRLQLAEWMTDPKNPLTPRVMVNRIWQQHFGKGIVSTPSDFGRRGKPPTHPDLLDYLAVRFVKSGWSIKAMHRLIMLSRTYQLASDGRPENGQVDPGNDLLWKFQRRRLDAESLRDAMLAISGELDPSMGGPHPFPHESTWAFTQHQPFTAVYDTRRRSVYMMVQRFQRHPYLSLFDGADPNLSTEERLVSTTPVQALFMMNSPFVHEQSERFAARLIRTHPNTRNRIDRAYRVILSRPPTPEELRRSEAYLQEGSEKLKAAGVPVDQHPEKALASFVRVLLSSNEFIYVN